MRGVKYNISLLKSNNEKILLENLLMNEVCDNIILFFINNYGVKIKVSNHIIYNMVNGRAAKNSILTQKCEIIKL